eukprot:Clim_evm30s47 gene=Clim_evmTU30s47
MAGVGRLVIYLVALIAVFTGYLSQSEDARKLFFARAWSLIGPAIDARLKPIKEPLFGQVSGRVLEFGCGPEPSLAYLNKDAVTTMALVEPNREMLPGLTDYVDSKKWTRKVDIIHDTIHGAFETGALKKGSFDYVISSLVLCSVPDQVETLQEVYDVLKPGGKFLFVEHVGDDPASLRRRIQEFVKPAWKLLGDNCHPDRDTEDSFRKLHWSDMHFEYVRYPYELLNPFLYGYVTK